jgi:hypothetical protein
VLDEVAARDARLKLLSGQEVVVGAVLFPWPRRAGGGRDRQLEARGALEQPADQRAFADP